ncbi:uncharacterized protein EV154DRAFT_569286 [Mucor mucedo]|uniref:uncharacterized protein n=1 Tax=Mucor mucedo TaxID=29922 RepID=UPI00221F9CFC|nr:uncharacterized protein EV154DRAFT_569286 [Mucor mucedo]KAI7876134.1 hypothetical protein EV154DRAFT_569286 [Mucor mucedo]
MPGYLFDSKQFAEACGADLTNVSMVEPFETVIANANLSTFKFILLIMPAVILAFLAFVCVMLIRKMRKNNIIPFIGTFTSLFGFFAGGAGLALTIVTFWKGLEKLEPRVEGLSHQWGPSIYLVGVGSGCALFAFVCFVISLFSHSSDKYKRETYNLYDYSEGGANSTSPKPYDATTKLNSSVKHDSYNDYYHAVSSPTVPTYPSYYQPQQQYQQQYNSKETSYQQPSGNYY